MTIERYVHRTEIAVERLSNKALTKEIFIFKVTGITLYYAAYYILNRDSKRNRWSDEQPEPLSYERWVKLPSTIHDLGRHIDENTGSEEYSKYRRMMNPVNQKTRDGRPKMSGISASIRSMPSCPASVANKALKIFKKKLIVVFDDEERTRKLEKTK